MGGVAPGDAAERLDNGSKIHRLESRILGKTYGSPACICGGPASFKVRIDQQIFDWGRRWTDDLHMRLCLFRIPSVNTDDHRPIDSMRSRK
jgi:hypothetical protein